MRSRHGEGGQGHRRSIRRGNGGADPVNRVLLTAAGIMNEWRSMHPARRPGHARSWLVPSWPSGLLLARHGQRLVAELVADRTLRTHVRARLALPPLSNEDVATLDAYTQPAAGPRVPDCDSDSSEPTRADDLGGAVTRAVIARALIDPNDARAATGARLLREVPRRAEVRTARSPQGSRDGVVPRTLPIQRSDRDDDRQDRARRRHDPDIVELRRHARVSAAALDGAWKELAKARSAAEAFRAEVARLTDERDEARAALPSRRQRRELENASQLAADLKKARKQLGDLRDEQQILTRRHETEMLGLRKALAEAEAERDRATDARHRLETRLGDLPGRALYLQNLLRGRIGRLEAAAMGLPRNQARSRIKREIEQLRELSEHIDRVLPPSSLSGQGSQREDETLSGTVVSGAAAGSKVDVTAADGGDGGFDAASYRPVVHTSVDRTLRVEVLGGGSEIGGSAVLVEAGGTRVLVDAGVRPNAASPRLAAPPLIAKALEGRLDAVVVTHGHNDHAGFVPKLLDDQRQAATICTPATAALLPTMWADARRVMAQQADDMAEYGWLAPLYGEAEVEAAERSLRPLAYGRPHNVGSLTIQLFNAGHILGAAGVVVGAGDQRVVITGDIYNLPQLSVGAARLPPKLAREADLLLIESTYCHSSHRDRAGQVQDLVRAIEEVVAAGGRVLVPAFGLGRAQEVALILREHLPDVPVLVDGLARPISEIYEREAGLDIFGGKVQRVDNRQRFRLMRSFRSGVVITTSGMLSGGFAVPWAQQILPDPHAALFVCGYQDEESAGRALQRLADRDGPTAPATLTLHTDTGPTPVSVAARVETYSLSAHADRNGLSEIIDELAPLETMLVHGLGREQKEYRETLERAHGRRTVRNDVPWSGPA